VWPPNEKRKDRIVYVEGFYSAEMPDGEGEWFDLEGVWVASEAVGLDTQGMGSQHGVWSGTQYWIGMRPAGLDADLLGQLAVHSLDYLPRPVD
jgi:hypothetical protein